MSSVLKFENIGDRFSVLPCNGAHVSPVEETNLINKRSSVKLGADRFCHNEERQVLFRAALKGQL